MMDALLENYWLLFRDSFLTAIFPHDSHVLSVMLYYGGYNRAVLLAIATVASVLALLVDYLLARGLVLAVQNAKFFRPYAARHTKCVTFANRFAWAWVFVGFFDQAESALALVASALRVRLLIPAAAMAVESALAGVAGALKIRLWMFIPAVALGKAIYFAVVIYS